jgi:hypothetical protein
MKYLNRASLLYVAGYGAEVAVMCGAVLEAALEDRIPDEALGRVGWKPQFKRAGTYSVGQRLQYEAEHPIVANWERLLIQ